MKQLVFSLIVLFSISGFAQDSTQVETPIIVTKLQLGEAIQISAFKIEFKDVILDSRCPKQVSCIRAGEAKVLVVIYKDKQFIEEKVLEITPSTPLQENKPTVIESGHIQVKIHNLLPYPVYRESIKKESYFLQFIITD